MEFGLAEVKFNRRLAARAMAPGRLRVGFTNGRGGDAHVPVFRSHQMSKHVESTLPAATAEIIRSIYGEVPEELARGIEELIRSPRTRRRDSSDSWDERDIVLISYADQVRDADDRPLETLRRFLLDHDVDELIRCVHLLPFCPSSGDDGFSVIDYLSVDPGIGDWEDIAELGKSFDLMFDLVLNHTSRRHRWFQRYLEDDPEYERFYIEVDPGTDLSSVVRPRSLPLLTEFDSASGVRSVWTTFSDDQVDLNYANPRVMLAMIQTLVAYARRGARIVRLDAIAYLWKEIGTSCVHLPKTHAAVRLMRDVLDRVAPGTLVLTETNVPHAENVSYFGDGTDEAHLVYQFSLPPLLLDAIHGGDTEVLQQWLSGLSPPSPTTTFFNFTASHDGIGVRPLEGLVPPSRVERLVDVVRRHGGRVSMRRGPDGRDHPYELNITYLDAVADRQTVAADEHARRFLATQAVMLAMRGVPAVYFHSLVGTPNDQAGVEATGQNRRINRHKYSREVLETAITAEGSLQRSVYEGYRHLLQVRRQLPGFHPAAGQASIAVTEAGLIGFWRAPGRDERIAVLANLCGHERSVPAGLLEGALHDRLSGESWTGDVAITMPAFRVRWMTAE